MPQNYKIVHEKGVFVTDIWNDIRELTSGYLAGKEAVRTFNGNLFVLKGERFHKQQTPIKLLLRILLTSSMPNDIVLDLFAGTGTSTIVAKQLNRHSISIEIDPKNVGCIKKRIYLKRKSDSIQEQKNYYRFTQELEYVWSQDSIPIELSLNSNPFVGKQMRTASLDNFF